MTLRIQAGRYYRTRDGRHVGPMANENDATFTHPWHGTYVGTTDGSMWNDQGHVYHSSSSPNSCSCDLVAECYDEPSVVTRVAIPQSNPSAGLTEDTVHQTKWDGAIKPSPINPTKSRVGDRVRLGGEFEVVGVDASSRPICVRPSDGGLLWLSTQEIAEHIPAVPKPVAVGDRVMPQHSKKTGEVLAVWGDRAWVLMETLVGSQEPFVYIGSSLTRVDSEVT